MFPYIAEFIGTFILILVILTTHNWLIISITGACIILIGSKYYTISLNPAISIAHYANNSINIIDLLVYIFAEIVGAITAFMVYKCIKK
jgi:glycerol uptake facilitator-like aquaporin